MKIKLVRCRSELDFDFIKSWSKQQSSDCGREMIKVSHYSTTFFYVKISENFVLLEK